MAALRGQKDRVSFLEKRVVCWGDAVRRWGQDVLLSFGHVARKRGRAA